MTGETPLPQQIVTCRTEDCSNGGVPITLHDDGSDVECGVCGVQITDLRPIT